MVQTPEPKTLDDLVRNQLGALVMQVLSLQAENAHLKAALAAMTEKKDT